MSCKGRVRAMLLPHQSCSYEDVNDIRGSSKTELRKGTIVLVVYGGTSAVFKFSSFPLWSSTTSTVYIVRAPLDSLDVGACSIGGGLSSLQ